MSQGFVMDSQQDTQPAAKKLRQEDKQNSLPVTIRSVEAALARAGAGEELRLFGMEPAVVLVVAAVESVAQQATGLEMMLNDATGRIKARYFAMEPQPGELERIVPGCYVSAFGGIRTAPVGHLALSGLRVVDSADEVSYHVVEAAHAAMKLQRSPGLPASPKVLDPPAASQVPPPASPAVQGTAPAEKAQPATTTAPGAQAAAPAGGELRASILELLREDSVGAEGLSLAAISGKLGIAAAKMQVVIGELVEEGDLYNTISEEHFAAV